MTDAERITILKRELEQAALRFERIENGCEKVPATDIGIIAELGKENCRTALENTRY